MKEDESGDVLSAEETAFFESGGNTEIPVEQPTQPEQAAPEAQADAPAQDQARDEKGKFVPHQALHAEREEHKKTKAQLEEIARKQAVLEDRWNTLLKASAPPEQPKDDDPEPDPNVDFLAHHEWLARQFKKTTETMAQREAAQKAEQDAIRQEQQVWSHWQQDAARVTQEKPDFTDRVKYLSDMRTKQLQALAPFSPNLRTQQGINQQINAELKDIVLAAAQQGISPAEMVYQMAEAWGFSAPATPPSQITLPQQLAQVARAQEASKTIAAAPGSAAGDEMTAEMLLAMPDKDFEAWRQANGAKFRKLMGG